MPEQVNLHYFRYCVALRSGKVQWRAEYHTGKPAVVRHRKAREQAAEPRGAGAGDHAKLARAVPPPRLRLRELRPCERAKQ